ncbi:hypothetical protein AKN40_1437 [Escherichia coli]|nr:hypothetical protein AKN40_1437 [Escherichia coli]
MLFIFSWCRNNFLLSLFLPVCADFGIQIDIGNPLEKSVCS